MRQLAIKVVKVGKQYRIGQQLRYKTLRDTIIDVLRAPFRITKLFRSSNGNRVPDEERTLWALRDVSFEVQHGEVLGIIGRNGAGKSTLLKILSRITEPTEGDIDIFGRVGSLLEVGTGFHPELTGRENIYLNGAILGMHRSEIQQKYDQIVDFAEIEKFMDTPVKFYSSGMYMRLAFSVAAHLEPEILLVDEVLAVGDAAFQQKCLGKMGEVAKQGRTVLFVSHSMAAIQRLCSKVILLERGHIAAEGNPATVTDTYLNQGLGISSIWERNNLPNLGTFLERIYLTDYAGKMVEYVSTATPLALSIDFTLNSHYHNLQLSIGFLDYNGEQIFGSAPQDAGISPPTEPGKYHAVFYLPQEILLAKTYGFKVVLWEPGGGVLDSVDGIRFIVQEAASLANSTPSGRTGQLALRCDWELKERGK